MELKHISDSEAAYEKFFDECEAMAAAKFIMAERHIRDILKCIAGSSILLSVFAYAAEGFSFPTEFDRRVVVTGDTKRLTMPADDRTFAAFAYCLFMEVDGRSIDFHKLLTEFFYSADGYAESYKLFVRDVVGPFQIHVRRLRESGQVTYLEIK